MKEFAIFALWITTAIAFGYIGWYCGYKKGKDFYSVTLSGFSGAFSNITVADEPKDNPASVQGNTVCINREPTNCIDIDNMLFDRFTLITGGIGVEITKEEFRELIIELWNKKNSEANDGQPTWQLIDTKGE